MANDLAQSLVQKAGNNRLVDFAGAVVERCSRGIENNYVGMVPR